MCDCANQVHELISPVNEKLARLEESLAAEKQDVFDLCDDLTKTFAEMGFPFKRASKAVVAKTDELRIAAEKLPTVVPRLTPGRTGLVPPKDSNHGDPSAVRHRTNRSPNIFEKHE
jgi:hypothetical protein